ncbi:MAG: O-antigen polymerase family protein [Patescibacteria group bacterium]|nr:O-antigen polymerase family protein [Patescibacteria group bacterium]
MRTVILGTLVACVAVAMAPWMSGGQEPVAMLVSGGALLLGALLAWRQPEVRQLRRGPLVVSWFVLMGFAVLSLLWSANRYSTAVWLTQWLMAGLAFRLAYTVAGEPKGREWLVRAYLASAAVFSVVAIVMYMTGTYERLTGTFYWANPAAAYLIPALVLAVDKLRRSWGKVAWMWGSLTVFFIATFMLANSRAAILVAGVIMVLYLLVVPTPRRFWITFVFSMVMGIGLSFGLVSMSTLFVHKSNSLAPGARAVQVARAGESNSLRDRLNFMESGLEMWFDRPFGGMGAGTYGDVHPQYQQRVVSASTNAHNLYVQVLAELGIVGAVVLAAVLLWLLIGALRGVVAHPEMTPALLGLIGLLLHMSVDVDAGYPALLMLAAVLFGTIYRQWWPVRGKVRLGWPATAVLLLVPLMNMYQSNIWAARARVAQEDGDYSLAAERYAAAHRGVVYDPDYINADGIALYAVAVSGGKDGRTAAALALDRARQAETLDPHDGQHHQLEGRALAVRGDQRGAEAAFRAALRLDPYNHPEYALDLATVQMQAGDTRGSMDTARAMLKLYPAAVVSNRNLDESLRPKLANLEALVGNSYLVQGNLREAGGAAQRALRLDPKSLRGRALEVQVRRLAGS